MKGSDTPKATESATNSDNCCHNCWKPNLLCVCADIHPENSRLKFLILQHPQESRKPQSTARLMALSLGESVVHRVGLSWRSLPQALGREAEPKRWGVLYLGGLKESPTFSGEKIRIIPRGDKNAPPLKALKGIVILDGNWKQAKTLWWRNPWLLRLNRVQINPSSVSKYGPMRQQPRKSCLSSIESAAFVLSELGEDPIGKNLEVLFEKFVNKNKNFSVPKFLH